MHLLLAQKGTIAEGTEAIDLGQTPGDVLFLSAADTELASLASARRQDGDGVSLRLANMMSLAHPMSVDAYVERTARHAKLIVVRIIGGESYWPYGLEALHACAVNHKVSLPCCQVTTSRIRDWTGFRRFPGRIGMRCGTICLKVARKTPSASSTIALH